MEMNEALCGWHASSNGGTWFIKPKEAAVSEELMDADTYKDVCGRTFKLA